MKKFLGMCLMAMFLLSSMLPVMAEELVESNEISLTASSREVLVGEEVVLEAVSYKKGSTYSDSWENSTKVETIYDEVGGNYVSTGVFKATEPGVYTITYTIDMFAGKSGNVFSKSVSETIEVIDSTHIKDIVIDNLIVSEDKDFLGEVVGYTGMGVIEVVWSNGEVTEYGTLFVYFGVDQYSKDVEVSVKIEDETFSKIVTVNR